MAKLSFNFKEMEELAAKLENMGGNLQEACDKALHDTHDFITEGLAANIPRHVDTGATKGSLEKTAHVEWESPLKASVNIGFNLPAGGWPSIFLMWGTPKMGADTKLKNAAFGPKVTRQVGELQKKALEEAIKKLGG